MTSECGIMFIDITNIDNGNFFSTASLLSVEVCNIVLMMPQNFRDIRLVSSVGTNISICFAVYYFSATEAKHLATVHVCHLFLTCKMCCTVCETVAGRRF